MSQDAAEYTFVPWVREGYRPTGDAAPGSVAVELAVDATGDRDLPEPRTVETTLSLYGPGEVTGIDRRQVVRTDPAAGTTDFPPNYFPAVEFDRPDLPWLFSPEAQDGSGRVRPWLTLVTVEDRDGVSVSTGTDRPAPVLSIGGDADPGTELPDLEESWAWAHAQTVGATDTAAELQRDRSEKTLSRLLSPRRLAPDTDYIACVVPTYEAGRLAGLGEDVPDGAERSFDAAWSADTPPGSIRLPVYYHWSFSTGGAGDFESLVRRLGPETLRDVGVRTVDAGDPGPAVLENPGETVTVEGALRSTDITPDTYDADERADLRALLDDASGLTADGATEDGEPVVGPPTYGQWPAGTPTLPDEGLSPRWLRDLNVDPRFRVPAGYGTDVVQDNQEALMHNAWAQVGDIRRANQLLRRGRLARAASRSIHEALDGLDDVPTLLLTEPLLDRTTVGGETLGNRLAESALPAAMLSPAFRRLTRPTGPLARRFGGLSTASMVAGVHDGTFAPGDDASAPDGTQTLDEKLTADLCRAARVAGEAAETWHPLGEVREPAAFLDTVRKTCRSLQERTAKLREVVEGTRFEYEIDPFIEPLYGVCRGPDGSGPADLDDIARALETDDWATVHETLSGVLRALAASAEGHEQLLTLAESDADLANAMATDPGVTPAYEAFRSALFQFVVLVFAAVFEVLCRTAVGHLGALEKAYPKQETRLAELRVLCLAVCGDAKTDGLVDRIETSLAKGDRRALRRASGSLQQLLAMAADRVARLRVTIDVETRDPDLAALSGSCRAAQRYADALRAHLAGAPDTLAADAVGQAVCGPPDAEEAPAADLVGTAADVRTATDPAATIPARLGDRLGGIDLASRPDPLDQILAHPEFTTPMYEELKARSQESLVPGVGEIPGNSIGVLETNSAFVEAYLLGLSHEMARELRWREYPTDMRGTFFRQFWDPEGREWPSDEAKRDIGYVHEWDDSLGLGSNYAATMAAKTGSDAGSAGGQLVLVVRGELFDRYPNTHIYAAKGRPPTSEEHQAATDPVPTRVPDLPDPGTRDGEVKTPIFRGTLDPDITFFGFDITEAQALADPGWFFVIEEPPSEPTFGLDVAVADPDDTDEWGWEDLTWDDVAVDGYVSATTPPDSEAVPDTLPTDPTWATNGAHTAEITWQRPYRVAIHADDMIPQDDTQ